MVSDAEVVERLREFLRQCDHSTATIASVCRRLEDDFGIDLSWKKPFIREQVDLFLSELSDNEEGFADAEEEKVYNGPEAERELKEEDEDGVIAVSDDDDEVEEEGQEEDEDDNGKSTKKRKSKEIIKDVVKRSGDLTKLWSLSPALQDLVGETELARTEVVKHIWAYIREKNLQDPNNRRKIRCDERLHALFNVNIIDMFQINKALSKHICPLNSENDIIMIDQDDQIILKIIGDKFIPHGHTVAAYITLKFKERQCISGYTWRHVDQEIKDFYYREFLKKYTWEPGYEVKFKKTWNLYCQRQYKELLHKWRKKGTRPSQVQVEVWDAWQKIWSEEKWQKNSVIARNNRNSEVAGLGTGVTKHTAGSRSIVEHAIQLENTLQRPIDCWELFRNTHRRKNGTFVDVRSQVIDDDMTVRVAHASRPAIEGEEPQITSPDVINDIYYEVVGGIKKRSLYGLGSQAKVVFDHVLCTPRPRGRPSCSSTEVQELKAENEKLRAGVTALEQSMQDFRSRVMFSQQLAPPAIPDFSTPGFDSQETKPTD